MEKTYYMYLFILLTFLFHGVSGTIVSGITDYYQDEHCGDTLQVSGQTRLRLTQNYPSQTGPYHPYSTGRYQPNKDCQVQFLAYNGYQMMVFFKSLDIDSEDNCTSNWLKIDDGNSTSNRSKAGGKRCGQLFPKDVYTTEGRELTVTFHSDGPSQDSGFELIISTYHTGNCSISEFQCRNDRCVSNMDTCSGYNPCGDGSDCHTVHVPTYYLDENCNGTLYVSNVLHLNLTKNARYQPNMKCQVTISGSIPGGFERLMVYFNSMDIENEGTCRYDWVEIDDGYSRATSYIAGGKHCGDTVPPGVYTTSGNYMTLYFRSDGSNQNKGFDMVITPFHTGICSSAEHRCDNERCIPGEATCLGYNTCGDGSDCPINNQETASVSSVFLDDHCSDRIPVNGQMRLQLTRNSAYPPNLSCVLKLEANYGQRMMVFFRSLNIENQGTCNFDWVEIDDGISRSSPLINGRKLCGSASPIGVYESSGRYMTVYFHSDGSEQFSGFDMVITSYHIGSCSSDEFQCDNSRCIPNSVTCSGYNPCGDHSDCGGAAFTTQAPYISTVTYQSSTTAVYYMDNYCGSIISHGKFEQFRLKLTSSPNYQSDFQCEVTLETNPGDHMFIKFLFLDLEEASDCSYDWVELDDGSSRSAQYLAGGKQCGSIPPSGFYTTSGQYLTVYFHSDRSNQGSGFDLLIQPSVTEYMDQHCGGTINIGDYSQIRLKLTSNNNYIANIQCKLIIETNYGDEMMFYFRDLDMESNCYNDWLEIDDGSSRSDSYLAGGKKCGHSTPMGIFTTTGRYMTLYFESDGSVQGRGFDMIITSFRDTWYCNSGEHSCSNNRCINESLTCNGYNSCGDYSDCTTRNCKNDEFRCNNGRCIPTAVKCVDSNPCGDYSDCSTTTRTTTTTTDYYYSYIHGLSGSAITGITVGAIAFFILLFVAVCYGARKRVPPQHLMRRVPNVATFSAVNYAYENPVPIYYADTPPPYPGTTNTTAYPGTTTLYPESEGATISGTVSSIPSVTCGTTVPTQGSNGMAGFHSTNKTN